MLIYLYIAKFTFLQAFFSALISCLIGLLIARILWQYKLFKVSNFLRILGQVFYVVPTMFFCLLIIIILGDKAYNLTGIIICNVCINFLFCCDSFYQAYENYFDKIKQRHLVLSRASIWENICSIENFLVSPIFSTLFIKIFIICLNNFTICMILGQGIKSTTFSLVIYQYSIVEYNLYQILIYTIIQAVIVIFLQSVAFDKISLQSKGKILEICPSKKYIPILGSVILYYGYHYKILSIIMKTLFLGIISSFTTIILSSLVLSYLIVKNISYKKIDLVIITFFALPSVVVILLLSRVSDSVLGCSIVLYLPFCIYLLRNDFRCLHNSHSKIISLSRLNLWVIFTRIFFPKLEKNIYKIGAIICCFVMSNSVIFIFLGKFDSQILSMLIYKSIINYDIHSALIYALGLFFCIISILVSYSKIHLIITLLKKLFKIRKKSNVMYK